MTNSKPQCYITVENFQNTLVLSTVSRESFSEETTFSLFTKMSTLPRRADCVPFSKKKKKKSTNSAQLSASCHPEKVSKWKTLVFQKQKSSQQWRGSLGGGWGRAEAWTGFLPPQVLSRGQWPRARGALGGPTQPLGAGWSVLAESGPGGEPRLCRKWTWERGLHGPHPGAEWLCLLCKRSKFQPWKECPKLKNVIRHGHIQQVNSRRGGDAALEEQSWEKEDKKYLNRQSRRIKRKMQQRKTGLA